MEAEPASGQSVQRYYDPVIGQGLSVDPVTAYNKGDMRFFNRYAYAFNNPYKFNDPDGRESACFSNNSGCGLRPETAQDRRDVVVSMLGFATLMTGGLLAPEVIGGGSAAALAKTAVGVAERKASQEALKTTAHGAKRLAGEAATRGGVLSAQEAKTVMQAGRSMTQADGATVRIVTNEAGKSNVVVSGERGVITTFKNLSEKSLERLAKRYGWE